MGGVFASVDPRQFLELALVLFVSLLVGIEREEHRAHATHYFFGGVRTFPLLGLVGFGLARLSDGQVLPLAIGFVVIGGFMAISYKHKVEVDPNQGPATELSGLLTYLAGALVHAGAYWLAVALAVVTVLLLELREGMERLTTRVGREEVAALAKFLVLAIVILPVLPDRSFTRFEINPFRTWLVLVAVSGLSYASYVLQKWLQQRGGALLTALLGGAYSSTATTIVLARQAKEANAPRLYAASILAASGVMYVRMIVLVALFDMNLARALLPGFGTLALVAIGAGVTLAAHSPEAPDRARTSHVASNPLQLGPAFLFGAAFLLVIVLTRLAIQYVGRAGIYGLAVLMGLSDVDPFVLGLVQWQSHGQALHTAATAIVIATAANNLAKALYARAFADPPTGRLALALLAGLAAAGLVPLAVV